MIVPITNNQEMENSVRISAVASDYYSGRRVRNSARETSGSTIRSANQTLRACATNLNRLDPLLSVAVCAHQRLLWDSGVVSSHC